ncbi:MAG: 4-hydroxy-tetrahydrodipicolinate reductase [Bacteroidota bacterium]
MRILLIGYGKMGRAIEQVATQRGHQVVQKITVANSADLATIDPTTVDVAIEFSQPSAAYDNIRQCLAQNIPVIAGTTGWLEHKAALDAYCQAQQGTFFYAANFSIGVNIFFGVNAFLAQQMAQRPEYEVMIEEVHAVTKKDTPSGTALALAQDILQNLSHKQGWTLTPGQPTNALGIAAQRVPEALPAHTITYTSPLDTLEIKHTAHSREGFALGTVLVAEWLPGRQGVLGMDDFLQGGAGHRSTVHPAAT